MSARNRFIILLLTPAALLYGWLVVLPVFRVFQLSLYQFRGLSSRSKFVGLENYGRLASDDAFKQSLWHTAILLAVGAVVLVVGAGLIAAQLGKNDRLGKVTRGFALVPHVVSLVAVAIIWRFAFNPGFGPLNDLFAKAGLTKTVLGSSQYALIGVGMAFLWYALGFFVLLLSAGMGSVPQEVREAAQLDGTSPSQTYWKVVWPLLFSVRRTASIYVVVMVLNLFVLVWLMTSGGPDNATQMMLTVLYQVGIGESQYGRACAVAAVNLILALGLSSAIRWRFRRNPEEAKAR